MNCKDVLERIDEYLDGSMPSSAAGLLEKHATACASCRPHIAELSSLRQRLRELSTVTPPEATLERLLSKAVSSPVAQGAALQPASPPRPATMTAAQSYSILCVDDEPQIVKGLARQLGRHYRVLTATSGADALRILERNDALALVISDMRMARMDGAQFLARARRLAPEATRLLLTGHADAEAAARAVNEGGIHRLLMKPCKPDVLKAAVDQGVEQYRAARLTRDALLRQLEATLDSPDVWHKPADQQGLEGKGPSLMDEGQLIAELPEAIHRDALELRYQPIVDVRRCELIAFEALPAWNHPDFGLLPPVRLLPLAAESACLLDFDTWVLQRACREAGQLRQYGARVAINLSAQTLERRGFTSHLKQALLSNGLAPHEMELQLPDSVFRQDAAAVAPLLQELRSRGYRIALDDPGACFASLSAWERLPVDTLKIACSRVGDDPGRASVIAPALSLGKGLGLDVVAAAVDSRIALGSMLDCGAAILQGAALAAPLAISAIAAWFDAFQSGIASETTSPIAAGC